MPFRLLKVLGWIFGTLLLLGVLVSGFAFGGSAIGVPLILFIAIVAGWFVYVFFRYRFVRQEEIVQVLAAAAEAKLPLVPALPTAAWTLVSRTGVSSGKVVASASLPVQTMPMTAVETVEMERVP